MTAYTFDTLVPVLMLEAVRQVREPVAIMYEGKVVREVQVNARGGAAIVFDETENMTPRQLNAMQAIDTRVCATFVAYHSPATMPLNALIDVLMMVERTKVGPLEALLFDDGFFVLDQLKIVFAYSSHRGAIAMRLEGQRFPVDEV